MLDQCAEPMVAGGAYFRLIASLHEGGIITPSSAIDRERSRMLDVQGCPFHACDFTNQYMAQTRIHAKSCVCFLLNGIHASLDPSRYDLEGQLQNTVKDVIAATSKPSIVFGTDAVTLLVYRRNDVFWSW